MHRLITAALVSTCLTSFPALALEGPITAVVMSNSGVAEYIRQTEVDGRDTIHIDVPLEQVDDVLKSFVVIDSHGRVVGMELDGEEPVEEVFSKLPFTEAQVSYLPDLLGSLQGAEVEVKSAGTMSKGRILSVQSRSTSGLEKTKNDPLITLMDENGSLKSLPLTETAEITFLDEDLQKKIATAVAVAGRAKADGSREVAVHLDGDTKRAVEMSYVVSAPVWKTAYRVVTGDDGKARLQAWAILENASGSDWEDVTIRLVTGDPVTLTQRLHKRYWKERQEITIAAGGIEAPPVDEGSYTPMARSAKAFSMADEGGVAELAMAAPMAVGGMSDAADMALSGMTADASENSYNVSFTLPGKHDLANGKTLSVPIIDTEIPAQTVSVYCQGQARPHPVASIAFTNDTDSSLPPGILTIFNIFPPLKQGDFRRA